MEVFEIKQASAGTFSVAEAIAKSGAMSIIFGGDSSKVIKDSGFADDVSFISTGGGAYVSKMEVLQKFLHNETTTIK
jgi:phosphoglycerate kinase